MAVCSMNRELQPAKPSYVRIFKLLSVKAVPFGA